MAAVGVRPGIHPIGLPMEALRSSVWSSETLIDGVNHVTDQAKDFLMKKETESDEELAAEYQVASPLLYIFKLFIVVYNIHIYIYIDRPCRFYPVQPFQLGFLHRTAEVLSKEFDDLVGEGPAEGDRGAVTAPSVPSPSVPSPSVPLGLLSWWFVMVSPRNHLEI